MAQKIVVHGHFYQPPRENPWTNRIERQPEADPFHDWNERILSECYRPNSEVKIPSDEGEQIVNSFERISFNVGPTLMGWIQDFDPRTHERMIAADHSSEERLGHGNALAQAYHHTILPLGSARDARTQIRWGLADFRHRFGREAEGMWVAETAVDDEVLGILIDEGVAFTILAPWQASSHRVPEERWKDARLEELDTRHPYRYLHPDGSGREIAIYFYDAAIARAIAFERAASSSAQYIDLFAARAGGPDTLVHAATDGETYGHHQEFSDLGLAYALFVEGPRRGIEPVNYAAHLAANPPYLEVRIAEGEGTSWSCEHGVGRWKRDCGCRTGGAPGWNQAWRAPLRAALDLVKDAADETFGRVGRTVMRDPWGARDRYVAVLLDDADPAAFVAAEAVEDLDRGGIEVAHRLLEMQRYAMSMFTSCAWFFNDIGGIETVQILRYAAVTMELLAGLGQRVPQDAFIATLDTAVSNDPTMGTGADVYRRILETRPR